jgi:predicted Zn-dependent peptidase
VPQFRAFLQRWYRPEHMALVAVGDVDAPADLVQAIAVRLAQRLAAAPG